MYFVTKNLVKKDKKNCIFCMQFFVNPTGEVSNFLVEDFDAVLEFMNEDSKNMRYNNLC